MNAPPSNSPDVPLAAPKRQLTLFDSTSIIVGIIIGAFFYETSPSIARCASEPQWLLSPSGWLLAVWVLGGLFSLIGALCYAELAAAYPEEGGDYVYLTRAFGRPVGFLFAWAQLWVVRPGSVGALAYVFGRYANEILPLGSHAMLIYAAGSLLVLTGINILGVRQGKWAQNLLTTAKVIGLASIFVVGAIYVAPAVPAAVADVGRKPWEDFRLAMILVLYTYGGWNEMAYVGAEVRDPKKNILRALVTGTVAVTLIYVLATLAFEHALGYVGLCKSEAVAADVLKLAVGSWGSRAISLLICISALGAINGMIFTGARITYALGREHWLFQALGQWSPERGTPVRSLVIQAVVTLGLILGFGQGGFKSLVNFTTPVFWIFFLLVGVSLFVLRRWEPDQPRPYHVPLYPVIPVIFCLSSVFMVYASVSYAYQNKSYEAFWAIGILVVGLLLSFYDRRPKPLA